MVDRHFSHLVDDSSGWCTECGGEKKLAGVKLGRDSEVWSECKECGTLFLRVSRYADAAARARRGRS